MNLNEFLEELKKINIVPTKKQLEQLEQYYELLIEYNKVMNLTGITEKEEVYLKHFYDSLTLYKVIDLNNYKNLCDIGSGAGFPGIVLKIFFPELEILLIDSLNKRIKFLNIVIEKLNLKKISANHNRIEEFGKENKEKFDLVTARAVAPLNVLLEYSIPILKKEGYFIALKAKLENEHYENAAKILKSKKVKEEKFLLPKEKSNRTIILFKKEEATNKKYPRKNSDIKKNPL